MIVDENFILLFTYNVEQSRRCFAETCCKDSALSFQMAIPICYSEAENFGKHTVLFGKLDVFVLGESNFVVNFSCDFFRWASVLLGSAKTELKPLHLRVVANLPVLIST